MQLITAAKIIHKVFEASSSFHALREKFNSYFSGVFG